MCSRVKETKRGGYGGRNAMKKMGEWGSRILYSKEEPETLEKGETVGMKWGGKLASVLSTQCCGKSSIINFFTYVQCIQVQATLKRRYN